VVRLWLTEHGYHVRITAVGISIDKQPKATEDKHQN